MSTFAAHATHEPLSDRNTDERGVHMRGSTSFDARTDVGELMHNGHANIVLEFRIRREREKNNLSNRSIHTSKLVIPRKVMITLAS